MFWQCTAVVAKDPSGQGDSSQMHTNKDTNTKTQKRQIQKNDMSCNMLQENLPRKDSETERIALDLVQRRRLCGYKKFCC